MEKSTGRAFLSPLPPCPALPSGAPMGREGAGGTERKTKRKKGGAPMAKPHEGRLARVCVRTHRHPPPAAASVGGCGDLKKNSLICSNHKNWR